MKHVLSILMGCILLHFSMNGQPTPRPLPSPAQLAWHNMEYYLFVHFGPNTFTDQEWGHGDEIPDNFYPTQLDCHQWAQTAKDAGAAGIIITAKHHDGFCLWPSRYSDHTVAESSWKKGNGDVLLELSTACKRFDLKFGVYLSPWDRNHPKYGTPEYNDIFCNMLTEIFQNYGPINELWWDGANGEGPNGKKQIYDWERFRNLVAELSPETVIFSDVGPHVRWVGNEEGIAGKTNWNYLNIKGFSAGAQAPAQAVLNSGEEDGAHWIPAECDVSIRPGWFYHQQQDTLVKSGAKLFELYLKSVGRGANLLLNVPPDRRGFFAKPDSISLMDFKNLLDENFNKNLLKGLIVSSKTRKTTVLTDGNADNAFLYKGKKDAFLKISLKQATQINTIVLQECIRLGQTVKKFEVTLETGNGTTVQTVSGTTIGRKRILTFPTALVSSITIKIKETTGNVNLSEIGAYKISDNLIEK